MADSTPRTWGENAWPTGQQLADWLAVCTPNERLIHATIAVRDSQMADQCMVRHDRLEADRDEAWKVAARNRNTARRYYLAWQVARMRAQALRRLLDREASR